MSGSEKKDEEEIEVIKTPSFIMENGGVAGAAIVEEVIQGGKPVFAIWKGTGLTLKPSIEYDGKIYEPYWDDGAEKGTIMLPEAHRIELEEVSIKDLIIEIKEHIRKYVDVSSDFLEFSAWYILLTWVYDRLSTLPYLRAMGDYGTGKSRFMDVVGGLCYRPIHAGGATTPAAVARLCEIWKGTLLLNEADWKESDESREIVKILNEGFEKHRTLIKAHVDKQKQMIYYDVYGPKILATRKPWYDQALESRCLTEIMKETERNDITPILLKEFYDEQAKIRAKLLMFRFRNWEKVDESAIEKTVPKFGEHIEKRLIQVSVIFSTLFADDDAMIGRFHNFVEEYQRNLTTDRALSFDGLIVNTIYNFILEGAHGVSSGLIKDRMGEDGIDTNVRTIGKHLKTMGFETKQSRIEDKVVRAIIWNEGLLKRLVKRYVIEPDICSIEAFVACDTCVTTNKQTSLDDQEEALVYHATNDDTLQKEDDDK